MCSSSSNPSPLRLIEPFRRRSSQFHRREDVTNNPTEDESERCKSLDKSVDKEDSFTLRNRYLEIRYISTVAKIVLAHQKYKIIMAKVIFYVIFLLLFAIAFSTNIALQLLQ